MNAETARIGRLGVRTNETGEKIPFYASRGVDEVVVDPATRTVTWLCLADGEYVDVSHSELLDLDVTDFAAQIDWPAD